MATVNIGEFTSTEGCDFSLADAKHDFHTIFKTDAIKLYVSENIPYSGCKNNPLSEDQYVDKYALNLRGDSGSEHHKSDPTFVQTHLNENLSSRYEVFYVPRPQHKVQEPEYKNSKIQECLRKAGILDDVFFICDVAYANVREDLKFVNKAERQTFYWVQNAQTLYDPAGKTSWHSDKPYFETEEETGTSSTSTASDLSGKILADNHFKSNDSKFLFCWQDVRKNSITFYPKWNYDEESVPYKYSYDIPETMLYTNKDLFLTVRTENPDDYSTHEAYLIITHPDKLGYYGYADKELAAKGSGILKPAELASYRAKGNELKTFMRYISNKEQYEQSSKLYLNEIMNYSPSFQTLAKKAGDASQSLSCCQKILYLQKFKNNELGLKAKPLKDNVTNFESNGNHAFVSFDRIAIYTALNFNAPIVIGNTQEGFTIFIRKDLMNIHKQINNYFTKNDTNPNYQITNSLKESITPNNFILNDELLNSINLNKDTVKTTIIEACTNLNITPSTDITYQLFFIMYFNEINILQLFSNLNEYVLHDTKEDHINKIKDMYINKLNKIYKFISEKKITSESELPDSSAITAIGSIEALMSNINDNINIIIDKIKIYYNGQIQQYLNGKTEEEYKLSYKYSDDKSIHAKYLVIIEVLKDLESLVSDISEYQKLLLSNNESMKKIITYQSNIKPIGSQQTLTDENNKNNISNLPKGVTSNIISNTPFTYYLTNSRPGRNSDVFFERSTSIFGTTTSILQIFNILNCEKLNNIKKIFVQIIYNTLNVLSEKATAFGNVSFITIINAAYDQLNNLSIIKPIEFNTILFNKNWDKNDINNIDYLYHPVKNIYQQYAFRNKINPKFKKEQYVQSTIEPNKINKTIIYYRK